MRSVEAGRISLTGSVFQDSLVRARVSCTVSQTGIIGRRAVSAKRRTWSSVIAVRLRLPPQR